MNVCPLWASVHVLHMFKQLHPLVDTLIITVVMDGGRVAVGTDVR